MKEAFGGTFTLKLIMVFFVVYVTFMGVALQIAKCYRIKNSVINYLEQSQYTYGSEFSDSYKKYLKDIPYNIPEIDKLQDICEKGENKTAKYYPEEGICIEKKGDDKNPYYVVSVYFVAEFPFLGVHVPLTISGETMTIKDYS